MTAIPLKINRLLNLKAIIFSVIPVFIIRPKHEILVNISLQSADCKQQVNINKCMLNEILTVMNRAKTNDNTKSYITGVGDVTLSCELGQQNELIVHATTHCRTKLCSMHIFRNNVLLQQHNNFVVVKGLHELATTIQGETHAFLPNSVQQHQIPDYQIDNTVVATLRFWGFYVLSASDRKLRRLNPDIIAQNTNAMKSKARVQAVRGQCTLPVCRAENGMRLTFSGQNMFKPFFRENAKFIAKVVSVLNKKFPQLTEARGQCINAAILCLAHDLECDMWAPTMQAIDIKDCVRENLQNNTVKWQGHMRIPTSGNKLIRVRAFRMQDPETVASIHTTDVLGLCVNSRIIFLGCAAALRNVADIAVNNIRQKSCSLPGDSFMSYTKMLRFIVAASNQHDFIRVQKEILLSQLSDMILCKQHKLSQTEYAHLRMLLQDGTSAVNAFLCS